MLAYGEQARRNDAWSLTAVASHADRLLSIHRVTRVIVGALGLSFACGALAQAGTPPIIAPDVQGRRDTQALQILRAELLSEEASVTRAEARRAARINARDPQGVREAEQTLAAHTANVAALRREISDRERARASHAREAATLGPSAPGSIPSVAPRPILSADPRTQGSVVVSWDLYRGASSAIVSERPTPPAQSVAAGLIRRGWDIYAAREGVGEASGAPPPPHPDRSTVQKEARP